MPVVCEPGQRKNSAGKCFWPEVKCAQGQVKNSAGKCYTPKPNECREGQKRNSKGVCYFPKCPSGQARNSRGVCVKVGPSCDARTTVRRGDDCACRYSGMRKVNASRCVCRTGLPPIKGVGCVKVDIERGRDGDAAGTGSNKTCVNIAGVRVCR